MTSSGDLSLPTAQSISSTTPRRLDDLSAVGGADLVFTQVVTGQYLSFYWQDAERYGFNPEQVIGQRMEQSFTPLAIGSYLERLHQVLSCLKPLQFECAFSYANQSWLFDLTISPVLVPQGVPTMVLVMGTFLRRQPLADLYTTELYTADSYPVASYPPDSCATAALDPPCPPEPPSSQPEDLIQVTQRIGQTLDLQQIWQQSVDELGTLLGASRCLICPYQLDSTSLVVTAEYRQPHLPALLGTEISLAEPYVREAITTLTPVFVGSAAGQNGADSPGLVVIPTYEQGQPNSLILAYLAEGVQVQGQVRDLLQAIAEPLGVGIAHAMQFAESLNLIQELQQVNETLMQQHSDLEEARQQAEAASRLKSEFLANTSHELRTPLNGIIGFLKLIMDGMADDPEEQLQFIQEAHRSAIHLFDLINDVLDIAKIEAGKMQLDLNLIRLDDLLLDVENFTRPQAQQKQLSFEIRTPDTRDEVLLYGNYQRLKQVMLNLVGNAIKFTHEGSITISAEVVPGKVVVQNEEKPGSVKISVADTGIGVSLEKQDKLFQSFSQVDGSRTRQYGGTGLGLAISQKLVEAMGGVVNFFSMGEGLGSTVTFTVPLYQDPVMITAPLADSADLLLG